MNEQRFLLSYESEPSDDPGLVMSEDGAVSQVKPGGERVPLGGSLTVIGPISVDYTELLNSGDSKVLYEPNPGDILLNIFWDISTAVGPDHSTRWVLGPNADGENNLLAEFDGTYADSFDMVANGAQGNWYVDGTQPGFFSAFVLGTDPVIAYSYYNGGPGIDNTQGHLDVYVLVAVGT